VANLQKKTQKVTKNEQIILHTLPQKPKTVEMQKLAQTYLAHDVRMMPELFVFNYALLSYTRKCQNRPKMCCSLVK